MGCEDKADICDVFQQIYAKGLMGRQNEYAQTVQCGNPQCQKSGFCLTSMNDYENAASACVVCGMARCDLCNPTNGRLCSCSSEQVASTLVDNDLNFHECNHSLYSAAGHAAIAPVLVIARLPTGAEEGLQYTLKSE